MDVNKLILSVLEGGMVVTALYNEQQQNERKTDHRQLPRSTPRLFRHDLALVCIERDYIGDTPLLSVEFKLMF
jgi:hypothetical protein